MFVTRKLATLAVDAVIRAAAGLSFLTAAPFMGYGGDASAASMDVKVGGCILHSPHTHPAAASPEQLAWRPSLQCALLPVRSALPQEVRSLLSADI